MKTFHVRLIDKAVIEVQASKMTAQATSTLVFEDEQSIVAIFPLAAISGAWSDDLGSHVNSASSSRTPEMAED